MLKQISLYFAKRSTIIRKYMYVTHYIDVPKLKVKVTIWGQSSKYVSAVTQKNTKANFIKLHRKTRHHERYAMLS